MIQTERLNIYPLSDDEMRDVIKNESNKALKAAYSAMLAGCLKNPEQRIWHAMWVLQLNDGSGRIVGSFSFKGLNDNGMVEIGYGMNPGYEGKGFMTEAVSAAVRWASKQPGVLSIEAETEPENVASQRVLEKAGFIPSGVMGTEGPRYVWKTGPTGVILNTVGR
jgi:Acetyltransferases, including N-acetylases of ribosomal proteins